MNMVVKKHLKGERGNRTRAYNIENSGIYNQAEKGYFSEIRDS